MSSAPCEPTFLDFSARKLRQMGGRIEDCLRRLTAEQIWARGGENENAIGNLVLHLCGNVRQWIISGVGGEADIRQRDAEFVAREAAGLDLAAQLRDTVVRACGIIAALPPERLTERLVLQGYQVTVLEAIYAVVEHFSGHTGQIVYVTKMLTGEDLGYYRHLSDAAHAERTP